MDWDDVDKHWKEARKLRNMLRGVRSILEIQPPDDDDDEGSQLYHPARTDLDALRGDWQRVGSDLKRAMDKMVDDKKAQ